VTPALDAVAAPYPIAGERAGRTGETDYDLPVVMRIAPSPLQSLSCAAIAIIGVGCRGERTQPPSSSSRRAAVTSEQTALPPRAPDASGSMAAHESTGTARSASSDTASPVIAGGSPANACKTDAECVLTTFSGCCSCCPCAAIRATTKKKDDEDRRVCAYVSCGSCDAPEAGCVACTDPSREGMRARCRERTCVLVETKAKR
jgi:hypothetical protein